MSRFLWNRVFRPAAGTSAASCRTVKLPLFKRQQLAIQRVRNVPPILNAQKRIATRVSAVLLAERRNHPEPAQRIPVSESK